MSSCLQLIGAGPGDPELITLKAVKAIAQAEVILYDALVNKALLEHASPNALRLFVGKRKGRHSVSQEGINRMLMDLSTQYQRIVRLKGGDPFVFGRAVEEMQAAAGCGMRVEIIPGISSALAVPASQTIPLTCRGIAESFWVMTGTTQTGKVSGDIRLAARSSATIVILMAMHQLKEILAIFEAGGKAETPAAIIQNGTLPEATMVTGRVKDIYTMAVQAGLGNPAVIVIGEVVDLAGLCAGKKEMFRSIGDFPETLQKKRA